MSDKRFLCRIGLHKCEDLKIQQTKKDIYFGYALGLRLIRKCKHCDKLIYLGLNLSMPNKYLYQEKIWED